MKSIMPMPGEDLLELGKRCDAVYVCPKIDGVRKGPLVVYAGKDMQKRNLVGDIYFNFRRIERHLRVVEAFAVSALNRVVSRRLLDSFDTICGIPNGGRTLGMMIALYAGKGFVYPDKMPKLTDPGKKQEYVWDLSQFDFDPGERVAVVEDVFNNFQNTDSTIEQVAAAGAEVTLLIGALNRSPIWGDNYAPRLGRNLGKHIPVVASVREVFPEYEQDDPEVEADMIAGNVEFQVKKNWARLRLAMES